MSTTAGKAVSAESIAGAGRLFANFVEHHARARDHLRGDADERMAAMLLHWMRRNDRTRVTVRDVQNGRAVRVRRKQHVEQLFRVAEELGLCDRVQIDHQSGGSSDGFEAKA